MHKKDISTLFRPLRELDVGSAYFKQKGGHETGISKFFFCSNFLGLSRNSQACRVFPTQISCLWVDNKMSRQDPSLFKDQIQLEEDIVRNSLNTHIVVLFCIWCHAEKQVASLGAF